MANLQAIALLERRIKAASAEGKTLFHPDVRQLRAELRAACEAALFADYARAQRHELEQLLWKSVFYRPIEEFRRRIKEHAASRNEDLLAKTRLAFSMFLDEGRQFYAQLAAVLQGAFGYVGYDAPGSTAAQQVQQVQQAQQAQQGQYDCRPSVYRCLICMGDLARYKAGSAEPAQRDWADCQRCYLQAAQVYPQGGNAYNQLAVLATYQQDELAAAFYYLRALSVPTPFPVARENLVTALGTNRTSYARLAAAGAGPVGGAAGPLPRRGVRPLAQLERELRIRWVRVLGMLHLKLDLDAFPDYLAAALADLEDYLHRLGHKHKEGGPAASPGGQPAAAAAAGAEGEALAVPPLLLMLALCAVGSAHSVLEEQPQHGAAGGHSETLQCSVVVDCALTAVAELAARLAHAASGAQAAEVQGAAGQLQGAASSGNEQLLPAVWVMLRWAAVRLPAQAPLLVPGGSGQPAALAAALLRFWAASSALVLALGRALDAAGPSKSDAGGQALGRLPEDLHCFFFAPLELSSGGSTGVGAQAQAQQQQHAGAALLLPEGQRWGPRVQRALSAAGALADTYRGSQGQQQGPEAASLGEFLAAVAAVGPELPQQRPQQPQQQAEQPGTQAPASGAAAAPAAAPSAMDVDGTEEVILFKPPATTPRPPPPLSRKRAAQQPPSPTPTPLAAVAAAAAALVPAATAPPATPVATGVALSAVLASAPTPPQFLQPEQRVGEAGHAATAGSPAHPRPQQQEEQRQHEFFPVPLPAPLSASPAGGAGPGGSKGEPSAAQSPPPISLFGADKQHSQQQPAQQQEPAAGLRSFLLGAAQQPAGQQPSYNRLGQAGSSALVAQQTQQEGAGGLEPGQLGALRALALGQQQALAEPQQLGTSAGSAGFSLFPSPASAAPLFPPAPTGPLAPAPGFSLFGGTSAGQPGAQGYAADAAPQQQQQQQQQQGPGQLPGLASLHLVAPGGLFGNGGGAAQGSGGSLDTFGVSGGGWGLDGWQSMEGR